MLLAYLYTSETTRSAIKPVIKSGRWESFPDAAFLDKYGLASQGVRCLLVYDGDRNHLVGFADANQFASELMAYQKRGFGGMAEKVLNQSY